MKTIIFALGLLVLCSAQLPHFWESSPFLPNIQNEFEDESAGADPKSSLQLIFDGLWEQGGLNAPKDIINCFNEQSANETLNFIGKMLTDIGRSNAVDITKTVIEYEKTISISTVYCFGNDTELTDLRVAYGVSNLTVPQLYVAIEKYILLHLKNLTTSAAAASFYFDQAQYKQVGTLLGQVAQTIVNKTHEEPAQTEVEQFVGLDPKQSLQLIFDGLWEQGGLNDPKKIINCFNENSANDTLIFIGKLLVDISRGNAVDIPKTILTFEKSLSTSTIYCFGNDTELADLRVAYKLSNYTVPQMYVAMEKYIILHLNALRSYASNADFDFTQGQYKQTGVIFGQVIQDAVNKTSEETESEQFVGLDPKQSLQLIFDGLWEQGGLNDPKDIINCFNENSANETLIFIGKMLVDIARGNAVDIPTTILTYEKTVSTSTIYCFGNDTELADLRVAYKLSNYTVPQMYVAMEKYILLHLSALRSYASNADFDFTQGQYKQTGVIFGQVIQDAVNKTSEVEVRNDDPLSDLQSLLNGIFEQAGLADPKNVTQCFNETTAQVTLDFFGDVVNDLAKDDYLSLIREYHVYAASIPKNVSDCIKNDPETTEVYDAYGFNNENGKTLLQKYLTFGIRHHVQLLNDTKTITDDMSSGDYLDAGKATGILVQAILGGTDLFSEQQIADGLEDVIQDMILNGY